MAMNPSPSSQRNHQLTWLPSLLLLLLSLFSATTSVSSSSSPSLSYSSHCGSIVPESTPIHPNTSAFPFRQTHISHYTGGDRILNTSSSESSFGSQKYVSFRPTRNVFRTKKAGIYKIEAYLTFYASGVYYIIPRNSSRTRTSSRRFSLNGFWSEYTGKLCMVGSASSYGNKGTRLNHDAVLQLNFAMNSSIDSSLITAKLESLASPNDLNYFEPVSILLFSSANNYQYSLVSGEFESGCRGGIPSPQNQSLGLEPRRFCSVVGSRMNVFKLKYHSDECGSMRNCSPLGQGIDSTPREMSLNALQCSEEKQKVQYLVTFRSEDQPFDPAATLVAEGSWDKEKKRVCVVACRILNSTVSSLENARVGDCSIRLSLRYPAFWSLKSRSSIVGQIWTNKTVNESGYFNRIELANYEYNTVGVLGLRYEYTVTDRIREICPMERPDERKRERYPQGGSSDMKFDMSITDSRGRIAWGYAVPVFVGDETQYSTKSSYGGPHNISWSEVEAKSSYGGPLNISWSEVEAKSSYGGPLNISYSITVHGTSGTSLSLASNRSVEISAEGVYDDETGSLCMIGCRKQFAVESVDCELLLRFQFPPTNAKKGGVVEGSIESMRKDTDPLYFERLNMSSMAFYAEEAKKSVWRMDLEIAMVLISNTLACIFVRWQIFHVRRHPQVLPFASLLMLAILTLGHMIPLVLNFEALFLGDHGRYHVLQGSGGWLEVNEVVVRIVTMVAFLLQFRLLQLAFYARLGNENQKDLWVAEIKALCVSTLLFITGANFVLILLPEKEFRRDVYDVVFYFWGNYLRSRGGLVLDGFLFPQILLNMFLTTGENALSLPFYIGTTCVRLLPHAYDLYRAQNYAQNHFDGAYIYADPWGHFYSFTWDVVILCGGVLFAVVIYLQQRFRGRYF